MQSHHSHDRTQSSRGKWVLIGFLVVAAYFLWTEHRAHLMGALPYLLLLACPLMHIFHHGHGGHHDGGRHQTGTGTSKDSSTRMGEES